MIAVSAARGGSTRLINRGSILYVQSHGDFVRIVTEDGRYLLRTTLNEIERRWEPFGFVRVHRQYVANLARAIELRPLLGGTAELGFGDGQAIPVARRHVADLEPAARGLSRLPHPTPSPALRRSARLAYCSSAFCSSWTLPSSCSITVGIAQRRDVAERAAVGDVAQQPAHDLARAGLGQVVGPDDPLGTRELADPLGHLDRISSTSSSEPSPSSPSSVTNAQIAWPSPRRPGR